MNKTTEDLAQVAADAKAEFGSLSAEQLNWKPRDKDWSVAQCFDHLIVTHGMYFELFERLAGGDTKMSFWERTSPFSGFFGRFLIKSLDPKNVKKMKTTANAQPSSSTIGSDIIERFCEHQDQLVAALQKLPATIDPARQIVTSPLMGLVTYSLADTFTFIPMHCWRHFNQAKRVTETEGFPK